MNTAMAINNMPETVLQWLACGERGVSSDTMVQHLFGQRCLWMRPDHPHDPDDFQRCEKLLLICPEVAAAFPRMADCSPIWAALVKRWDEIASLLEAEVPGHLYGMRGHAPKTYSLMRKIIKEARDAN